MRNWHPIWFMRYVVEDFPDIVHDYLSIALALLVIVGDFILFGIHNVNVTIYNSIVLLFNRDNNLSE